MYVSRVNQRVFGWFRHMERIDEHRMARRMLVAKIVEGGFGVDRGKVGWMIAGGLEWQRAGDGAARQRAKILSGELQCIWRCMK